MNGILLCPLIRSAGKAGLTGSNSQNFSLTFVNSCVQYILEKTAAGKRELVPAFLFLAVISAFPSPKQLKSRPLESINYEIQIL